MTLNLRIIATILGIISAFAFRYDHKYISLTLAVLAILLLIAAIFTNRPPKISDDHKEEQRALFKAALKIIEARTRITLDLINDFKAIFEENRHFIGTDQEDTILDLISALGDVRINDAELADKSMPLESRPAMVTERRVFVDRVENMKSTIDKYLRKIS